MSVSSTSEVKEEEEEEDLGGRLVEPDTDPDEMREPGGEARPDIFILYLYPINQCLYYV